MASYEKGKYSYEYNGKENTIYYNEAETNAAFKQISSICGDALEYSKIVADADKCFDSVPKRYSSLIPSPRYSGIKSGIERSISGAQQTVCSEMNKTISAICDYCNGGDFSEESQKHLDNILSSISNTSPSKKGGGGGGDGGGGGGAIDDSISGDNMFDENLELVANEKVAENILSTVPLEDTTTSYDEKIVLGQVEGGNGKYDSGAVVPFTNSDETLDVGDGADGVVEDSSELGTSLFGSSSFSVPSMLSSNGKVDGIKGAGVLGAAGVAAAAAAAIGGKVFYDKKHNDDEDDDEFDDDIAKMNEESGSDVNGGFMSGLNSVDFKSELLSETDGDE